MLDWLDRQRKRSKAERARTAFLIALSVTVIVVIFWLFSLPAKFQALERVDREGVEREGGSFGEFDRALDEGRNTVEQAIEATRQQQATSSTTTTP